MLCRHAGSFAFGTRPVSLALHGARATPLPGRRWLRSSKTAHRTLARGTPTPKMSRALAARHRASKAVTLPACLKTGCGRNMPASAGREVGHLRTCFFFALLRFFCVSTGFSGQILLSCEPFSTYWPGMSRHGHRAGMTMQQERWLSVDEIAAHLGVNPDTVYKWIERKKLPAHKVGRLWKFQVSEVNDWVRAGKAAENNDDK